MNEKLTPEEQAQWEAMLEKRKAQKYNQEAGVNPPQVEGGMSYKDYNNLMQNQHKLTPEETEILQRKEPVQQQDPSMLDKIIQAMKEKSSIPESKDNPEYNKRLMQWLDGDGR